MTFVNIRICKMGKKNFDEKLSLHKNQYLKNVKY